MWEYKFDVELIGRGPPSTLVERPLSSGSDCSHANIYISKVETS
jgi:hypothetical protein